MKNTHSKTIYPQHSLSNHQILEKAAEIISSCFVSGEAYTNPTATKQFVSCKLAIQQREIFAVMFLNNQHQLIEYQEMFQGTIDAASVYPREVVKAALKLNAAAVIFAHNHPSGCPEPSSSDIAITKRLTDALGLLDIRVLDHLIVGASVVSLAERGLL